MCRNRRPAIDEFATYEVVKGTDGRTRAVKVKFANDRTKQAASGEGRAFAPIVASAFLILVAGLVVTNQLPPIVIAIYFGASLLAFGACAWDKASAQSGRWRTQESTLLFPGLVGGWPGALLAQKTLRHKSKKRSFIVSFWITVLINSGMLRFLLTDAGSMFFAP